jgi:hypothetical protein
MSTRLGALMFTDARAALASFWFTRGVKEAVNWPIRISSVYAVMSNGVSTDQDDRYRATMIFGATLLLVPYIGASYAASDEGALWVRRCRQLFHSRRLPAPQHATS